MRAAALGYIPNAQTQALARSSSGMLGLIAHDIADPDFSSIARGVQSAARELGKILLLTSTEGTPTEERLAVEAFTSRRADAIVMAGSRSTRTEDSLDNAALKRVTDRYLANGGSLVLVGHDLVSADGSFDHTSPSRPEDADLEASCAPSLLLVSIPNEFLARELGLCLADEGFSRYAIVAGPEGTLEDFIPGLTPVRLPLEEIGRKAARAALTREDPLPAAGEVILRESTARRG